MSAGSLALWSKLMSQPISSSVKALLVFLGASFGIVTTHGNQFSKMFNSKMVILTSSETNNHSNNVDFVTKIIHLRSE